MRVKIVKKLKLKLVSIEIIIIVISKMYLIGYIVTSIHCQMPIKFQTFIKTLTNDLEMQV